MTNDHKVSFQQAKLAARVFNILCIVATLAVFADNDKLKLYVTAIVPFVGIFLMMFSNGRIALVTDKKKSGIPTIFWGLVIIITMSYFASAQQYHLLSYQNFWIPFAAITVTMALFLIFIGINRSAASIILQYVLIAALSGGYAVGTLVQINCVFDNSAAIKFNTVVQDKSIVKKARSSPVYHLVLSPWERGQDPIDIEVSQTEYEQTPVDGPVGGHIKRGFLNIKWFYLDM